MFEESATVDPPVGAACVKVAVQLDVPPEVTVVGAHCRLVTVIDGVTVTDAVPELPFNEAVIVTAWFADTVPAVALKLAEVDPAATVTEAGSVSAALLSERLTAVPPLGAGSDTATVHADVPPEETVAG